MKFGKNGLKLYLKILKQALRHDPGACNTGWLPKKKIEEFVTDKLKEKVLTDDNLATLVNMVNEEIRLFTSQKQERLKEINKQLDSINQKLLKYYMAFENGTISDEDAAPRIRDLRNEQTKLQKAYDEALVDMENTNPEELDSQYVLSHVEDLKDLLSSGTLLKQKAILKTFIKKIDFDTDRVAINYTIPLPVEEDRKSKREVLSIGSNGGPFSLIDRTANITFNAVFTFT